MDAAVLRQRWGDFVRRGGGNLGMNLLFTLHAELWLRAYHSPARMPRRSSFEKKALAPAPAE